MSWAEELDAFERALAEQVEAVHRGDVTAFEGFRPCADLGALPVELVPRARDLLRRAEALVAELAARVSGTGRELAMLGRIRPAAASASYVDQSL